MSTLPPGQRPVGTSQGAECPPGMGPVSITVTDCANGDNLGIITPFTISTKDGQFATSVNGVAVILCAAAGFKFTVGLDMYFSEEFTITAADVQAQHRSVCLKKKPPPPQPPPPTCIVHSLTYTDEFAPSGRALERYYRVRDVLASTPRGAELVELYYEPETKKRTFDAVQASDRMRVEGLALIIELQSVLDRLAEREGRLAGGRGSECACAGVYETEPLLAADVMRRASRFLDMLEEASGAIDLIAMTRELLAASEQGLRGIVEWTRHDVSDPGVT